MRPLHCLDCEYDLRGCAEAARCPECGVWIDVRGVAFPARRGVVVRAFAIGFFIYMVVNLTWILTYDFLRTQFPLLPQLSADVMAPVALATVIVTYLASVPAYRIGRRVLIGNTWPWRLSIEDDEVRVVKESDSGSVVIKRWPISTLYTVNRRRVPGGCGIRIGAVRILGLVSEREFEVRCRPVEAEQIVQHIQLGIDSKTSKTA